jgi:hypothetical protein
MLDGKNFLQGARKFPGSGAALWRYMNMFLKAGVKFTKRRFLTGLKAFK